MANLTNDDFLEQLKDQLDFIESSMKAFEINEKEAKRVATIIRVLVHDTPNSISLLQHLNQKHIKFYDTKAEKNSFSNYNISGSNVTLNYPLFVANSPYAGLLAKEIITTGSDISLRFKPLYKHHNEARTLSYPLVNFQTWWDGEIFDNKNGHKLTRKDLVLDMANKDGGAHVDSKVSEKYLSLKQANIIPVSVNGIPKDFENIPAYSTIMQIAWETLMSIKNSGIL